MTEIPPQEPTPSDSAAPGRPWEVFVAFLIQGLTAFGGPFAHLGYFRREFVERRGWLSPQAFGDLLALSQFLPGPASSQLGMAIGLRRAGVAGALCAWAGFTLPAGAAMIGLAYAAPMFTGSWGSGWIHGLQIAAVAVVLQALIGMARTLAQGPVRTGMAIGATVGLLIAHGPLAQIFALAAGGAFGYALLRESAPSTADDPSGAARVPRAVSTGCLIAFAVLLALLPFAATLLQSPSLSLASVFYRTGALVFGGGHVVLPLVETEVVGRGWMDQDLMLAGYGLMQGLPGPLLSFAGFVGAAQSAAPGGWATGVLALVAIFLPSLLLVLGVAPHWDRLRVNAAARGALAGVNATVVGLLAATLWDPVLTSAVRAASDWALAAGAFVFLSVAKLPPWAVVLIFAIGVGMFGG